MNLNNTFSYNKTVNKSQKRKNNISFGCRVLSMVQSGVKPNHLQEEQQLRTDLLVNDKNSLKNQSPIRPKKNGNCNSPYDYEDLYGLRKIGNRDGWGIYSYNQSQIWPQGFKNKLEAKQDNLFTEKSKQTIAQNPKIIMAHIRAASPKCKKVDTNYNHPYTYKNWTFMHNGFVPGALSFNTQLKINWGFNNLLGDKPKSKTDSESSFYYFLGKLKQNFDTTDASKIGKKNLKKTFAETINDLIKESPKTFRDVNPAILGGIKGSIYTSPSCNFVVTDGNMLMAYRKGPDLYLGVKNFDKDQKEYIISSEVIAKDDKSIEWLKIPQNHMVYMEKTKKDTIQPEITPLAKYYEKEMI